MYQHCYSEIIHATALNIAVVHYFAIRLVFFSRV